MTFEQWWDEVETHRDFAAISTPCARAIWFRAQETTQEEAAAIADAYVCGCGDHATEVGRKIRELPIE